MIPPRDYSANAWRSAETYINETTAGKTGAGELERLAVARFVRDYGNPPDGCEFVPEAATRIFEFFSFLRHWKGELAGQQITLEGWQAFNLANLFGWLRREGVRRFRVSYNQLGRKQGKTTIAAGVGLFLTASDREPGAECYTAATKRDQARLAHHDAVMMRRKSPELAGRIKELKDILFIPETGARFMPLGRDSQTLDGLNSSGLIIDELHAHKTRELWDVLQTSTGARRQPLTLAITTAGYNLATICGEQRIYAENILRGSVSDDSYHAFITEPDKGADWTDPATWRQGNPNIGVSVKIDQLQEELARAIASPAAQNAFRRFRLNEWTQARDRWIDLEMWNSAPAVKMALEGRPCWGGLDLSSSIDITAFVLCFAPDNDAGPFTFLPFFWIPAEGLQEREHRDKCPYSAWVRDGWIKTTPGNVVDYKHVKADIIALLDIYQVHEIAYDRWNSAEVVQTLQDNGATMVPFGQGYASMSSPAKEFLRLVQQKRIAHLDNPVMRWMAGNTTTRADPAGNIKPDKAVSTGRIDGVVAAIMALARALAHAGDGGGLDIPDDYEVMTL